MTSFDNFVMFSGVLVVVSLMLVGFGRIHYNEVMKDIRGK